MLRSFTALGLVVLSGLVVGGSSLAAGGNATTCTSSLAPGSYGRVVVPAGAVCITDSGQVSINGGLYVEPGATFAFGDEESPDVNATINGGVHVDHAMSTQIHFSTINGGIEVHGGAGPFGGPFEVTFNTFEDNQINGAVTIDGYNGFWQGFFRNTVNGTVYYINNTLVDPDGNEIQTNVIHGGLNCGEKNDPAPQQGDSEGNPNIVTGQKTGQCAGL